jgi:hypothetical protein
MVECRDRSATTVSIITRRLREGKTYEDFRKAWFHTTGFGLGQGTTDEYRNRMFSLINMFDPREVIVIGFSKATPGQVEDALKIEVKFRGENPLDDVVEPGIGRTFGLLIAEDDFSAIGQIPYTPAAVQGEVTDMAEFDHTLHAMQALFSAAAAQRDAINEKRNERG